MCVAQNTFALCFLLPCRVTGKCVVKKKLKLITFSEPGSSLGIGLRGSNPVSQQQGNFVQCILEDSPAAHDGRLRWIWHRSQSCLLRIQSNSVHGDTEGATESVCINPLSTNIHKQILQTDLYTFPIRISWEKLIKDQRFFSLRSFD